MGGKGGKEIFKWQSLIKLVCMMVFIYIIMTDAIMTTD
jgi:hypothetical protein